MGVPASLRALLFVFALGNAFALNLDSIPIWNPASLAQYKDMQQTVSESTLGSSRLETHGYKTMQVTVGDGGTQVDQELRLSIQGFVGDSVYIDALLSDVDRRAGDQTTATLQEVDQIYFRAESRHWMVHLGDFTWKDDGLGLFSLERSSLGAMVGFRGGFSQVRGAAGTDEVERTVRVMNGVSGQREGYAISDEGEFLSIVPGSESVWLNGVLLVKGRDYEINYAGGLLDFIGKRIPSVDDEIRVEYDAYEDEKIYNLYAASGSFRHPNLYLDVSGFRLENDRHRLRRSVWSDEDYAMLKADKGEAFERADSLGLLHRPIRTERVGARLRLQGLHRYYGDFEIAMNRTDSNTVSRDVDGPEGRAFRWYATTDSSSRLKALPIAFSVYGNFIEDGFRIGEFQGTDNDWDAYILKDQWDLDSSFFERGALRHDEFGMRVRFGAGWFGRALWGYRQGVDESWNSSRVSLSAIHENRQTSSNVDFVRVASVQGTERERYQVLGSSEYLAGIVRPYGNFDGRYTQEDSLGIENEIAYGMVGSGINFEGGFWNASEGFQGKIAKRRGDSYGPEWADSLKSVAWTQTAMWQNRYVELNHFLQYERRSVDSSAAEHSWVGDVNLNLENEEKGISGEIRYKLGLTEEQTYTAIYKAVAPGTGDVRYDSLTGSFIEGVDNGDYVYEGMGRNDSIGAVLASSAAFGIAMDWNPGKTAGITSGFLRDITLFGNFDASSEDTTGRKIYFPAALPSELRKVSSGNLSLETGLRLDHPLGVSLAYRPGVLYEKKLSSISYFESSVRHSVDAGFKINENHFVGGTVTFENVELEALQDLEWNVRDFSGRYRYNFFESFHMEPGGRFRTGKGQDDTDEGFSAALWEGFLRLEYEKENMANGYMQFTVAQMEGDDMVPYQMMDGFGRGRTYRFETNVSVDVNHYISAGLRYIIRFGDAEENVFQKLSSEVRAYF